MERKYVTKCFVPKCPHSSVSSPERIFFNVPRNRDRITWYAAVGKQQRQQSASSLKSPQFCCDVHFDMNNDVEGWTMYRIFKASRDPNRQLRLKKGVLPHIFPKNELTEPVKPCSVSLNDPPDVEKLTANAGCSVFNRTQPEDPKVFSCENELTEPVKPCSVSLNDPPDVEKLTANAGCSAFNITQPEDPKVFSFENEMTEPVTFCSESHNDSNDIDELIATTGCSTTNTSWPEDPQPINYQALSPKQCSKETRLRRKRKKKEDPNFLYDFKSSSPVTSNAQSQTSSNELSQRKEEEDERQKIRALNIKLMENNSKFFLGVNPSALIIIDRLSEYTQCSRLKILIALRKIRCNESATMLGFMLGYSNSYIGKIIREVIPKLADYLRSLIYQPNQDIIQSNLPVPFRASYSDVAYIIDCFEIEIEKPSNPVDQALTWSEYYKANTLKYFVSATPDGFINFISGGFGGRISDLLITKECGFLQKLLPRVTVMADRGFKNVETILEQQNCKLVRPPSVKMGEQLSEEEVKEGKKIASLRIHIERVIGRLREYEFLSAHSLFHHDLVNLADSCVIIAAALANLQTPLTKT
ncbi:uncharacterized protein [Bemisia tabaci]|uniref:uncharacterized protein n=1 Tax=Bemisia tabaci TaxID=7038 RepID=UPI003B288858